MINLFQDVKLTKGYNRSIIQDFTKNNFEFIDNELFQILTNVSKYKSIKELIQKNPKFKNELQQKYILNNFEENIHNFPEIPFDSINHNEFQAIVIEFSHTSLQYINKAIFSELTQNLFFIISNKNQLEKIDSFFIDMDFISITYVFIDDVDFEGLNLLRSNNSFIKYSTENQSLSNNILVFFENSTYNSGYFEKLFINASGEVRVNKNDSGILSTIDTLCSTQDYINLKFHPFFLKMSHATHSKINVCNECELRNMCTDLQEPFDFQDSERFYKKIECKYNPYISKWEGEEGYLTLTECGVISNEHEFSIDYDKLAEINNYLWGDE